MGIRGNHHIETRGASIGYWHPQKAQLYAAAYFFFRYNADGSFASFANIANAVTQSTDGTRLL